MMKRKYEFSYYMRILIIIVIYIIFFFFVIKNIIEAKDLNTKIFNIIIMFVFGGFGLLYEALRITYDAATKRLIVDDKALKALDLITKVEKFDLFKSFKSSCQMMKMLALMDLRKFDELIAYIDELDKKEIREYDVAIVARYTAMVAYGENKARGKSNDEYKKLIKIRDLTDKKGRRRKGAYFFNWDVVNGQHKIYENDYQSAYNYLNKVDETNMNKRELMHYLLAKLIVTKYLKNEKEYLEIKERLNKLIIHNEIMKDYIAQI